MPGTVLLADHVFGGLEHERATLGEIGYTLEEAPDTGEATLAGLAGGASAILVCFAKVTAHTGIHRLRGRRLALIGVGRIGRAAHARTRGPLGRRLRGGEA